MGKIKKLRVSFFVLLLSIFCLSVASSSSAGEVISAKDKANSLSSYEADVQNMRQEELKHIQELKRSEKIKAEKTEKSENSKIEAERSPLSPEFSNWQRERDEEKHSQKSQSSNGNSDAKIKGRGIQPSPRDFSHLKKNPPKTQNEKDKASSIPAKYDLRDYNRVPTAVRDQGDYGTCWAHATMGALESNYMTQGLTSLGKEPDLSELHMAWFVYKDPEAGHSYTYKINADHPTILDQGGSVLKSTAYLGRMAGAVKESSMPYTNAANDSAMSSYVGSKKPRDYPTALMLKGRYDLGVVDSSNRNLLKEMIMKYGGAQISYWAGEGAYSPQDEYSWFENNGTEVNHGVVIVGWNDNYSKENFDYPQPSSNGAWIVRNSWGSNYAYDGYFYMSYEQYISSVTFFIAGNYENENYYGYDDLGDINAMGTGSYTMYAANVFKAKGNEQIKSVGFFTTDNNAQYEIYVCNDLGTSAPSTPFKSGTSAIASGTEPYAGYHTIDVSTTLKVTAGHYFSVVVKMTTPNYNYPMAFEEPVSGYANAVINAGESYYSSDGSSWNDGKYKWDGVNFCIKAFTVSENSDPQPDPEPDPDPDPVNGVAINSTNFPDSVFRSFVAQADDNGDNVLSQSELDSVKRISVNSSGISSLKGIEHFTKITWLSCYYNNLTELDVSKNTALTDLWCFANKITALDVTKNTVLVNLAVGSNEIKKIDVSKNKYLDYFSIYFNELAALDVTKNTALTELDVYHNKLTHIDLTKNTKLTKVDVASQRPEGLKYTQSSSSYTVNLKNYLSSNISKVKSETVKGYASSYSPITTTYKASTGVATFTSKPQYLYYVFDSGYGEMDVSFYLASKPESANLSISANVPSAGTVGTSYTANLTASGGTSYTWKKASGTLPTGLKLSSTAKAKVILSGEPSKAGKFTFTLRVTDASGVTADKKCTVTIAPKVSGTITAKGTVGTSYTANLTASGGTSYTWKKVSGTLPTGLKLSSTAKAKVVLSGTPSKAGKFTFTLRVTDASGVTADKKCTVTIAPKVAGTITAKGTVGTSYTANLTASGGTSYTWKKASGTLPTGLKLSSTSKAKVVLSGKPTKAGKFTFTLRVTDASGVTADKKCTVTIAPKVAGTITAKGIVGTSYTANLTASGGTSYSWKKASGTLPTGLKLSSTSKAKVVLSGTPTKAGEFTFTLRVTDESGATADKKCTVTIAEKPLAFSGTLKDATLKKAYTGTVKITGGTSPYKWSISGISGTVPSDLEFWPDGNIIEITCKPTKTGSFSFTLKVKDKNSKTISKKFTVKVVNASTSKSASSQSEAEKSENVESVETPSEISLNNKTFTFENEKSKDESSYFKISENIIKLEILSDDILWKGEGKDEDLIGVRVNEPVRFIIGNEQKINDVSEVFVYIDEQPIGNLEMFESKDGIFEIPAGFIKHDFKIQVKDEKEFETNELYISVEEEK